MNRHLKPLVKSSSSLVALAALLLVGCFQPSPEQQLSKARDYLERRENVAAVLELKALLDKQPSLAPARALLARSLLETGDVAGAEVELKRAKDLGLPVEQFAATEARLFLQQGALQKLITEHGGRRLKDSADDVDLRVSVAAARLVSGQQAEARQVLDELIGSAPDNARLALIHARLLAAEGKTDEALTVVQKVLSKSATNSSAWQLKAELLQIKAAPLTEIVAAYDEALKVDPKNPAAHAQMIEYLLARGDVKNAVVRAQAFVAAEPNNVRARFLNALVALRNGDLKIARERIQLLSKSIGDNPRVLLLAGTIDFELGSLLEAETALSKAINIAPEFDAARLMLARTRLKVGNVPKALADLQPLLERKPVSADALMTAGEIALRQGDYVNAEVYLRQASSQRPGDTTARTALALINVASGRDEKGFEELRSIAAVDTGVSANLALISNQMAKGLYAEALKSIDDLERKQPGKPLAPSLTGDLELSRGRVDAARTAFEQALTRDPTYWPSIVSLSEMDAKESRFESAIRRFDALIKANPKHVQAQMAILNLKIQSGVEKDKLIPPLVDFIKLVPQAPEPRLALVRLRIERFQPKLALEAAQEGLAALPDNIDMLDSVGLAHMAAGEHAQAMAAFTKITNLRARSPHGHMRIAELSLSMRDNPGAKRALRKALQAKPDYLPAQGALMRLALQEGRQDEAKAVAREVQVQRPREAVGFIMESNCDIHGKNFSAAIAALQKALEREPTTKLAMRVHGTMLVAKQSEEAARFSAKWLERNPQDEVFIYHLGDTAMARKDWETAERQYLAVLKLAPRNAAAANNIAWARLSSGKPGALDYAKQASSWNPRSPGILDTLADCLIAAGQPKEAAEAQRQALAIAPTMHAVRLKLAKSLVAVGDKQAAAKELEQLAALGTKFKDHAEVKLLLASAR